MEARHCPGPAGGCCGRQVQRHLRLPELLVTLFSQETASSHVSYVVFSESRAKLFLQEKAATGSSRFDLTTMMLRSLFAIANWTSQSGPMPLAAATLVWTHSLLLAAAALLRTHSLPLVAAAFVWTHSLPLAVWTLGSSWLHPTSSAGH